MSERPHHQKVVPFWHNFFAPSRFQGIFAQKKQTMKRKDLSNAKEVARQLYLNSNMKQKEIAERLSVSEVTVSRWAKAGQWETLKKNLLTSKYQRLGELYTELEEFNRMIKEKEGYKVATSHEADARRKLIMDIKQLEGEYSISNVMTIGMEFCDFVKKADDSRASEILDLYNAFVNDTINKAKWQDE